jgi:hypothetical protein
MCVGIWSMRSRGTQCCSWLRHCATSQKVAGLISDGVTGFFYWHNPFGPTMALGSTQPLTEMSTSYVSWGYRLMVCRADNLRVPIVLKSGSLNLLDPSGPLQACNGIALPFTMFLQHINTQITWPVKFKSYAQGKSCAWKNHILKFNSRCHWQNIRWYINLCFHTNTHSLTTFYHKVINCLTVFTHAKTSKSTSKQLI